jgi:hypothetical protein
MSEPAEIEKRFTNLETNVKDVLRGHTRVLNSLGKTQREHSLTLAQHGKRLDRLERKVDEGFARMDDSFAQVDANFAQVDEKLAILKAGQDKITELLTLPAIRAEDSDE